MSIRILSIDTILKAMKGLYYILDGDTMIRGKDVKM